MPRNTRKFRGGTKKRTKAPVTGAAKKRKLAFKSGPNSIIPAPVLDIKSDADVKKAIGIMNKHPLTVVLMYAVWCPHCHTFMDQWNKYKKLPNRNSPMVACEQTFMNKLMPHIQTKDGSSMSVDGFPTVLVNMNSNATGANSGSAQNVGIVVEDPRNEEAMSELLTNSADKVTTTPAVSMLSAEPAIENSMMGVPSASIPTMGTSAVNASVFEESIQGSQAPRKGTPYPRNSNTEMTGRFSRTAKVGKKVASAIRSASNAAKDASASVRRMREIGSDELSKSDTGTFVTPPRPEGMSGGGSSCAGPSGLCQLGGGRGSGYSRVNSLLSQLGGYVGNK